MGIRVLLLFNPRAGRADSPGSTAALVKRLLDAGFACELAEIQPGRELPRIKASQCELLVVYGGDGTLHHLLPSALETGLPIGLIPGGTANVLAREIGIPSRIEAAVEILRQGKIREMYLAQTGVQRFLLMAGVGADAYLLQRVPARLKSRLGIFAFWLTGFAKFWSYPLEPFRVGTSEEHFIGTTAVISNGRFYGRHLLLAPRASVFEPVLDLCVFRSRGHLRYLAYVWASLWGRHVNLPDVVYRKTPLVWAEGTPGTMVQMDGEPAGALPRRFQIAPERLQIVCP
ncbi:MAG: diacylglycerol kinase family protein [Acidobacteriota bacterium]